MIGQGNDGLFWWQRGDDAVRERLQESQKAIQQHNETVQLKADVLLERGQYQLAIDYYLMAILQGPKVDAYDAYNNRGRAYHGLGEYQGAIQDFDEAIRLPPPNADPYFNRGLAYDKLGNSTSAEQDLAKAKELGFP
jgi:tetratricopeptide (TPR) repeat protein